MDVPAWCTNCNKINRSKVYTREVGIIVGDYDYIIATNGRKVEIPKEVIDKMTIAMALGLPVYISSDIKNYSVINED